MDSFLTQYDFLPLPLQPPLPVALPSFCLSLGERRRPGHTAKPSEVEYSKAHGNRPLRHRRSLITVDNSAVSNVLRKVKTPFSLTFLLSVHNPGSHHDLCSLFLVPALTY